jgi:uncharacterized membrane protein YtjA (UPF0391 family)
MATCSPGGRDRLTPENPSLGAPLRAFHRFALDVARRLQIRRGRRLETTMLRAAIALFIVALIAAAFGYSGIAASAAGVAKILALVFLVLAVLGVVFGALLGRRAVT